MAEPQGASQAPPPTQTLYDGEGKAVEVPLAETSRALAAGLGFAPGQRVFVADAAGRVRETDAAGALSFFGSVEGLGGRAATASELQEQSDREAYGGTLGQVGAGAAGLARGASLGLSDVAISELGGEGAREGLRKLEQYNPTTSTVAEVGGALAPALLSGGGSAPASGGAAAARAGGGLLARGAGTAARVVSAPSRAAEAVGRGVAGRLGGALGAESLAARVVAGAAAPAVEGAIGAAAQEAARAYVDDSPLTADRLLAAGATGLALGAGAGATFALGGEAIAAGGRAVGRGIEGGTRAAVEGAGKLARAGGELAQDVVGAGRALAGEAAERAPGVLGGVARRAAGAVDEATGAASGATRETVERAVKPLLDDVATRKALTSTGAGVRKLDELAERGGEAVERVAGRLHDELPGLAGKRSLAEMSRAEIAAAATRGRGEAGRAIGSWLDELDGVARGLEAKAPAGGKGPNVRPNVARIVREVERDVLAPLDAKVLSGPQAKRLRELTAEFGEKAEGLGLRELHSVRAELDDLIFEHQVSGARQLEGSYRAFRGLVEDELNRTADRIIVRGGLPEESFGRYKKLKQAYADYVWLDEASNAGAWRQASNRTFGLSEQFGVLGGLAVGGAPGAVFGAVAQSFVRRYGDQVAATWARRAGNVGAFEATTSMVDELIGDSLRRFFGLPAARRLAEAGRDVAGRAVRGAAEFGRTAGESVTRAGARAGALADRVGEAGARASRDVGASAARAAVLAGGEALSPREQYREMRGRVRDAARTLPARSAETFPDVRSESPTLADRMHAKSQSIAENIASRMAAIDPPKGPGGEWSGREPLPSDWDAMGVLSYARGATEPLSVCEDLSSGVVDHDAIEGLRENYPDLYTDLQSRAVELATEHYDSLPYERRVALGVLLDVPTDDTLDPAFLTQLQSSYAELSAAQPPAGPGAPPALGPGTAPNLSGALAPESQQQREMLRDGKRQPTKRFLRRSRRRRRAAESSRRHADRHRHVQERHA